jgi:heptosyltransferase-2
MHDENILIWLPSPMGDAILCTPALRAMRKRFQNHKIYFLAEPVVRDILSPSSFNNEWLVPQSENPFAIAAMLKPYNFTHAILFKNSFASALSVWLAKIPVRIGYARQGRSLLLTEKLYPTKSSPFSFKPASMIDYYLAIVSRLGADTADRHLELSIDSKDAKTIHEKLPQLGKPVGPLVILVPGGAFGLSKCWPSENFAKTADWLIEKFNATVVISVSPAQAEKQIAEQICKLSKHKLINLAQNPLTLGQLKSLFAVADLVICNDTGPRHIAIALKRKIITLFGPNDPAWTETGYENEIKIVGNAPCAPCTEPVCKMEKHLCMLDISVETVCEASQELLTKNQPACKPPQQLVEIAPSFFVDADFEQSLRQTDLASFDAVFSFDKGKNLTKNNLASFRSRTELQITQPPAIAFLKRYNLPSISAQLKNWFSHCRINSFASFEFEPTARLNTIGINTPKVIAYGHQRAGLFERRSFIITEKIPNAQPLERKLPDFVTAPATVEKLKSKRNFIKNLAQFICKFHGAGFRHRDLYFSHIFYDDTGRFYLIDLARVFKPKHFAERLRIKDIAQLYYSAPGTIFSGTDRLRFYWEYAGTKKLTAKDKNFIRSVLNKAKIMARHDLKHSRTVPFES